MVAFAPLLQRSLELGLVPPCAPPSHSLQPMLQPTLIHRQVWADSHGCVPFLQTHGTWNGSGPPFQT